MKTIECKTRNTLILTVGLPRSGKTTWAKKHSNYLNAPIVNPDSIRLAIHNHRFISDAEPYVWATAKTMVKSLFLAGHDTVIVDATHTKKERIDFWGSDDWVIKIMPIKTTKEICFKRAKEENDSVIIPVIDRMSKQLDGLDTWNYERFIYDTEELSEKAPYPNI